MKPLIETFQAEFELEQMVAAVERHDPETALEIGIWDGGTLWHWLQIAYEVVAVDDRMRRQGDWFEWAQEKHTELHLYQGMSNDPSVIEKVEQHAPYDFLFIDADHTYPSVLADWNNYSPMVKEGGLVAFHDIFARPGYGVSRLWGELTSTEGCRYMEIRHNEVQADNEGLCGIGLIWV